MRISLLVAVLQVILLSSSFSQGTKIDDPEEKPTNDSLYKVNNFFSIVPSSAHEVNGWAFGAFEYRLAHPNKSYPKRINGLYTEVSPFGAMASLVMSPQVAIMITPYIMSTEMEDRFHDSKYFHNHDSTYLTNNINQINGLSIILFTTESSFQNNGVCINTCANIYYKNNGLNITAIVSMNYEVNGLALTGLTNEIYKLNGVAISGLVNKSYHANGLQIALFNEAKNMKGVQLGLWNKIGNRSLPFINLSF